MVNEIVFHTAVVRERKVNAVTCIADFVTANQIAFAIPLMNAVAAPIRDESGVAIFGALADSFFNRVG